MDKDKSQVVIHSLPTLNPSKKKRSVAEQLGDRLDDVYENYDEYPYDMELDFAEHPDIRNEDIRDGDEEIYEE